jgi:hypothetical protein
MLQCCIDVAVPEDVLQALQCNISLMLSWLGGSVISGRQAARTTSWQSELHQNQTSHGHKGPIPAVRTSQNGNGHRSRLSGLQRRRLNRHQGIPFAAITKRLSSGVFQSKPLNLSGI